MTPRHSISARSPLQAHPYAHRYLWHSDRWRVCDNWWDPAVHEEGPEDVSVSPVLTFLVEGRVRLTVNGTAQVMDRHTVPTTNRGDACLYRHPAGRARSFSIGLTDDIAFELMAEGKSSGRQSQTGRSGRVGTPGRPFVSSSTLVSPAVYECALNLHRYLRDTSDPDRVLLEEALLWLVRSVAGGGRCPAGSAQARRAVRESCEMMAAHFHEPLSLEDVAASTPYSSWHLSALFREQLGTTIHQYLTSLRLRAALHLVVDSDAGLTEVALDCGFSSHSHLTRVFRRQFGKSPRDARAGRGSESALQDAIAYSGPVTRR